MISQVHDEDSDGIKARDPKAKAKAKENVF